MAARKRSAAPPEAPPEDAGDGIEAEEIPSYGPYELVDVDPDTDEPINALSFGADPVVTLEPGQQFWTSEVGVALFLDEHPTVRKGA